MLKATKKIKYIEASFDNLILEIIDKNNIDDFVRVCDQQVGKDQLVEEKTIDIKPADNFQPLLDTVGKTLVIEAKNISFQNSNKDIEKIANQLVSIIRNPILFSELLKDLDNELGNAMQENNIQFNDNDLPEFIIAGQTHYIPGPPPQNYRPKNKGRFFLSAHQN
jgi:hypothetical protein